MENEMKNSCRPCCHTKGLGFGLVLMLVGALFLGINFGLIPVAWKHVVISWPMLLVFIGVVHLFKRRLVSATVLILVGGFFLLPRLMPELDENFIHNFWPLLLIVAGIVILLQRVFPKWNGESCENRWHHHGQHRANCCNSNYEKATDGFSKKSVFGCGEHIILDPEFKGGELNAVFGGLSLDLRKTNLPVGETHLDVKAVFGGITIFVPTDWLVETHLDTVFGGFQDNRLPKEPLDATRKLIITGSCVFGGGELKN